jgi:Zn-dependent protease
MDAVRTLSPSVEAGASLALRRMPGLRGARMIRSSGNPAGKARAVADKRGPRDGMARPAARAVGSFRLLRLLGFDILIHWSWLIIVFLLTWSLESNYLPDLYPEWSPGRRWAVGAVTSLLFFSSVLAHELAHAVVARRRGTPVRHITLYIFGGASALGDEPRSARDEFWIAIVGPATSLVAALLFGAIWLAAHAAGARPFYATAGYLAYINVFVAVLNLLPGFPLDGGRVLRAVLWGVKRNMLEATRVAGNVGRVLAGVLIAGGILVIFAGGFLTGFWSIFVGWFLWNAADSSYQMLVLETGLHGVTVGPLIERDVPRIPPDLTLRQLAHEHVLRHNRRVFFVSPVEDGDIQGLITLSDLSKTPEAEWDTVSVYRAMTPRDRLVVATPGTMALDALRLMVEHNISQIPVFDGHDAIGLLTRAALIQAIQLRSQLAAAGRS